MSILTAERIQLQATASSKEDAIQQAGQLLVKTGCVAPGYVAGMLAREETMSTFIGNGVAIPHGQYENIAQIMQAGISVLQVPAGVEWEDGEKAYLIIGIAAGADEHIGILSNLAEVVEDEETAAMLGQTTNVDDILSQLNRVPTPDA